mmetsp:Transcript_109950/g.306414  ORF Transcript_109950/g.306414 Transcript_109950/m.306414 type:complete len:410 (-) Transcript_109950:51-1280(-)
MYLRKKSIVSTCDNNDRKSFGAVVSSSTMARALDRNTSLPNSALSTRRMQISRSVKSKAPSCGQVTTFRMISLCTLFGWHIARSAQAVNTSHILSMARGSLLHKSILVSCASLSARNKRWQCSMRAAALPGRCSTSFRTSFNVCCTPLQVTSLSRASFTTASTTPLHSPKRSGNACPFHLRTSSSKRPKSPSSIAAWSGGRSRMACLMWSVSWRSVCSCVSVRLRASARRLSMAPFSSRTFRSHSARNSAMRCIMSAFSCSIPCSHSARKSANCRVICAFSSAICSHSARDSTVTLAAAAFSSARRFSNSAWNPAISRCSAARWSRFASSRDRRSSRRSRSSCSASWRFSSSWPCSARTTSSCASMRPRVRSRRASISVATASADVPSCGWPPEPCASMAACGAAGASG